MAFAPFNTVAVGLRPALTAFAFRMKTRSRSARRPMPCGCNDITTSRPAAASFLNRLSLRISSSSCPDPTDESPVSGLFPASRQGGFFR